MVLLVDMGQEHKEFVKEVLGYIWVMLCIAFFVGSCVPMCEYTKAGCVEDGILQMPLFFVLFFGFIIFMAGMFMYSVIRIIIDYFSGR